MSFKRALRLAPLVGIAALAVPPLIATAQPSAPSAPSYATREEVIRGTISGFNGAYTMYVRDVRGHLDNITLRHGTIINPTGFRLSEGQRVTVIGFPQGKTFLANEIDTPYYGPPPVFYGPPPPYYGP